MPLCQRLATHECLLFSAHMAVQGQTWPHAEPGVQIREAVHLQVIQARSGQLLNDNGLRKSWSWEIDQLKPLRMAIIPVQQMSGIRRPNRKQDVRFVTSNCSSELCHVTSGQLTLRKARTFAQPVISCSLAKTASSATGESNTAKAKSDAEHVEHLWATGH